MVAGANGANPQYLALGSYRDWEPHWGAGGIVFSSDRDGSGSWKIWLVQPDKSGLRKVGDNRGLTPTWTRDGRILFTEEVAQSREVVSVSLLNPANNSKKLVVDIQGYPAAIDIRPGDAANNLNPKSQGKIQVAVLSSRQFDALKNVNVASLSFGSIGSELSLDSCSKKGVDVNGDGFADLKCKFQLRKAQFSSQDAAGNLRFLGNDGRPYAGTDQIKIVPFDNADDFKTGI